jgi:hypothetical protein
MFRDVGWSVNVTMGLGVRIVVVHQGHGRGWAVDASVKSDLSMGAADAQGRTQ